MVTKKYIKRLVYIFNSCRGPIGLLHKDEKYMSKFKTILNEIDSHLYVEFYYNVMFGKKYFTDDIIQDCEKFLNNYFKPI